MATGFGEVSLSQKTLIVVPRRQLATIHANQRSRSGYFADIKDSRVALTQKHLLKDI